MPIQVNLFSLVIGSITLAFAQGDISFGEVETLDVPVNVGVDILSVPLRKRQLTLTARGVNANALASLFQERENVVETLLNATAPVTGDNIVIGPDTLYSMLLSDVQITEAPIQVGSNSTTTVQIVYNSTVYV